MDSSGFFAKVPGICEVEADFSVPRGTDDHVFIHEYSVP